LTGSGAQPEPGTGAAGTPSGLSAGRVGRPHGLDGSFYVTRPRARLLTLGATVWVGGTAAVIVRRAGTERRPIVRLEGIEDREGAEALRGAELTVELERAPALQEGEWWAHELEGCTVADGERVLGTVLRMIELPSCEALEVAPRDGAAPVLVPMVRDAVRSVRPAERRIDVDLEFLAIPAPAPAPDPGATPAPDRGATPAPDRGATPAPDRGATPAPDRGATPAPDREATPAPDRGATSAAGRARTPEPDPEGGAEPHGG
jgi:16S rRNA processing protein RimM